MRNSLIVSAILSISAAAFAQATVVSGYATNWTSAPGAYAAPFVPLVTTPSVALETGLPTQVGASNATAGNVAGATSAPLSSTSGMQATGSAAPQANANEQSRQGGLNLESPNSKAAGAWHNLRVLLRNTPNMGGSTPMRMSII